MRLRKDLLDRITGAVEIIGLRICPGCGGFGTTTNDPYWHYECITCRFSCLRVTRSDGRIYVMTHRPEGP